MQIEVKDLAIRAIWELKCSSNAMKMLCKILELNLEEGLRVTLNIDLSRCILYWITVIILMYGNLIATLGNLINKMN